MASAPISAVSSQEFSSALHSLITSSLIGSDPQLQTSSRSSLIIQIQHNLRHQHDWTDLRTHAGPEYPFPLLSGLPPTRIYVHPDEQAAHLILVGKLRKEVVQARKATTTARTASDAQPKNSREIPEPENSKAFASSEAETAGDDSRQDYKADIASLEAQIAAAEHVFNAPRREWALPTHLREKWSLRRFTAVFDSLPEESSSAPEPEPGASVGIDEAAKAELYSEKGVEGAIGEAEDETATEEGVKAQREAEVANAKSSTSASGRKKEKLPNKHLLLATLSDDSTVVYYVMHEGLVKPRQN